MFWVVSYYKGYPIRISRLRIAGWCNFWVASDPWFRFCQSQKVELSRSPNRVSRNTRESPHAWCNNKNLAYPCWFMKIMGATSPPFNEINPSTGGTKGPSTMDQPIGPWHDLQVLQFQRSRGPRKAVDPMCHPYTWMPIWDLLVRDLRDLVMTQST